MSSPEKSINEATAERILNEALAELPNDLKSLSSTESLNSSDDGISKAYADAIASSVFLRIFNHPDFSIAADLTSIPSAIEKKVSALIGKEACMFLSILVAEKGPNISKYGNVKINCQGKIKGKFTVYQLVDKKILARSIKKRELWLKLDVPIPINIICETVPYAPLMYARELRARGKDVSMFKKDVITSLPFEMQFVQAGSLPLTEKLRAAHITFTAKFLKSKGMKFESSDYNIQVLYSKCFIQMKEVNNIINDFEAKIVLKHDEIGMTVEKAEQM